MAKFRTRAAEIEAFQVRRVPALLTEPPEWFCVAARSMYQTDDGFRFVTDAGVVCCDFGDYLVRHDDGRISTVSGDVFAKTYEPVEPASG